MKNLFLFLFVTCIFGFAQAAPSYCKENLNIGWEPYEPFQYKDGNNLTGFDIDIVKLILDKMGCKYTFVELPWKRILSDLEAGTIHLTGSATKTAEREVFGYFSDAYVESKNVLFFKKGEAAKYNITQLLDITNYPGFKLGVIRGFEYGDDYTKAQNDAKLGKKFKGMLDEAGNENQQLQKIAAGRITAGIHNQFVGSAAAKALKLLDQLETSPATVSADVNHWLMSKKTVSPEFLKEFNVVLGKVKADGSYQKILAKYLN